MLYLTQYITTIRKEGINSRNFPSPPLILLHHNLLHRLLFSPNILNRLLLSQNMLH